MWISPIGCGWMPWLDLFWMNLTGCSCRLTCATSSKSSWRFWRALALCRDLPTPVCLLRKASPWFSIQSITCNTQTNNPFSAGTKHHNTELKESLSSELLFSLVHSIDVTYREPVILENTHIHMHTQANTQCLWLLAYSHGQMKGEWSISIGFLSNSDSTTFSSSLRTLCCKKKKRNVQRLLFYN